MTNYTTTESKYQTVEHATEWTEGSGVSKEITRLGPESLTDRKEIAKRLGWEKYGENLPLGWWLSGQNLATMKPETKFGQFKPDTPIQLAAEDEKPSKYITPKKSVCNYDAIALPHPNDPDYWQKIIDDPSLLVSITEGGKKSGAVMTCDFAALALAGVDMGLIKGKLVNNLAAIAVQGRPATFAFDSDILVKKEVQLALKKTATALKQKGCIVSVAEWPPELGKGIDDVLVNHGPEKVKEIMNSAIPYSEWLKSLEGQFKAQDSSGKKKGKGGDIPSADAIGRVLAEKHRDKLAFNNETLCWYRYEAEAPGVWSYETDEFIESIIFQLLKTENLSAIPPSLVSNVVRILRHELISRKWMEEPDLIPFENGVLDLVSGKLLPHSPGYKRTWSLPRKHDPEAKDWSKISEWLDFATGHNQHLRNILLAFGNAVLKGRANLQKFLHLIGIGGSGKGTFLRLLVDLVGTENTHTTTLEEWCGNRFEAAQAYKKRLVIFPDEDKGTKGLGKFKSLTGENLELRAEEKNKKSFKFKWGGMVVVASNFPIFASDSSSGMARRIISVPFNAVVASNKRCDLNKNFEPELAAFTNYLLSLSDEWVTQILRGVADIPEVNLQFWENKIREDSVSGFLNDKLIFDLSAQTAVGDSAEAEGTLYAAYYAYCQAQGHKPQAIKNFSPNLIETACTVLNQPIEKVHTKIGKVIRGLRLRVMGADDWIATYDSELYSKCQSSGDGSGDGLVTDSVTGQDVDSVSILALVTDKTPIRCEISEKNSEVEESETQNSGSNVEVYPSPTPESSNGKGFDPSPHPSPHPSPNPSPLKPGDRAVVSEQYPVADRRGQEVRVLEKVFFDDRADRLDYRCKVGETAKTPSRTNEFYLPVKMLLPLPLPKFEVGQKVKVCADYPIYKQFQGKSGTVTHVLGSDNYKIRFERRVNLGNCTTKESMDFPANWLELL